MSTMVPAQDKIHWMRDAELARKVAREQNKLLVVGLEGSFHWFNQIWRDSLFADMRDKFVFLAVRTSENNETTETFKNVYRNRYAVLVVDYQLNKILEMNPGLEDKYMRRTMLVRVPEHDNRQLPASTMELFRDLPEDATFLYRHLIRYGDQEIVWGYHLNTAFAYSLESKAIDNFTLKRGFRRVAEKNFVVARKLAGKDRLKREIIEIYHAISWVFEKPDKALSELDKISKSVTPTNETLLDYAYAYVYLESGMQENARPYYDKVINSKEEILKQALILKVNPIPDFRFYE